MRARAAKWLLLHRAVMYGASVASLLLISSGLFLALSALLSCTATKVARVPASGRARSRIMQPGAEGGGLVAALRARGGAAFVTVAVGGLLGMWHVTCWHPEYDLMGEIIAARSVYAAGIACMLLSGLWVWQGWDVGSAGDASTAVWDWGGEWLLVFGAVIFLLPLHNEQNWPVLIGLCVQGYCAAQVRWCERAAGECARDGVGREGGRRGRLGEPGRRCCAPPWHRCVGSCEGFHDPCFPTRRQSSPWREHCKSLWDRAAAVCSAQLP